VLKRSLQYLEDMHEYEETTEEKKDED